jgi:hypothetical protein
MGSLTRGGHTNDNGLSSRGFPLSSFTREKGVSVGSRRNHDLSETRADRPNDEIRRYLEANRKPIGAVPTRGQPSKSNPRIGGAGSTGCSKSIDVCESMSGRVRRSRFCCPIHSQIKLRIGKLASIDFRHTSISCASSARSMMNRKRAEASRPIKSFMMRSVCN